MCTYSEFVETYNNTDLTAHDVRRLTGLNGKQYSRLRAKAVSNGDIPAVRHMRNNNARYYVPTGNGWQVQKTINGRKIIVGRFPSENIAKKVVNACIEADWKLDKIRNLINLLEVKPKNYTCINNCWVIQKSVNGRNVVFNSFSINKVDESTVIEIVDFYRSNDWDITLKNTVKELFNIT